jgi:hypothetical protein
VIEYTELNSLIAERFGMDSDYNIVVDLIEDARWRNDTVHEFLINQENGAFQQYVDAEIQDVSISKRIEYSHRLSSILWLLMSEQRVPWGNVLIRVCW